ncbi:MAG: dienelactone hydrolase, partial [Acidimicrobiia bacterium]
MRDRLSDFDRFEFSHDGRTRWVWRTGDGPAVVVISEMPGITPRVAAFARRVAGEGFTAVLPQLFGDPGRDVSVPYVVSSIVPACISREFGAFATGRTSPVAVWLRALARRVHEDCGGPGVGAVGMCFTGGFALAMMLDAPVLAPVLSQPSLPLPVTRRHRRDVGLSPADLARVRQRLDAEPELCVLGLRFSRDPFVPAERFARLAEELGDRFVAVEIDSSPGNPHGIPRSAHSVLTEHFVDE